MLETTINEEKAKKYLKEYSLLEYLQGGQKDQLKPNYCDLARLHSLVIRRKVFTILEFGVGWSTLVMADALSRNYKSWYSLKDKPNIRNDTPFKIFSVDSSKEWIDNANKLIPLEFKKYVEFSFSEVFSGKFNGRMCHFFKFLPDVVPDFIYLDGPDPLTVEGQINGLSWKNKDRTVMSADILLIEPTLLPGTFVIVDGRTNNVRFLVNNLQRNWEVLSDEEGDFTTMELKEPPLGKINAETISYCLGNNPYKKT